MATKNRFNLTTSGGQTYGAGTYYLPALSPTAVTGSISGAYVEDMTKDLCIGFYMSGNAVLTFEATMEDPFTDQILPANVQWIDVTLMTMPLNGAQAASFGGNGTFANIFDFGTLPFHKWRAKLVVTSSTVVRLVAQTGASGTGY